MNAVIAFPYGARLAPSAKCRWCGCDDLHACRLPWGPCAWARDEVCSNPACLVKDWAARRRRAARRLGWLLLAGWLCYFAAVGLLGYAGVRALGHGRGAPGAMAPGPGR